MAFSHQGVRPAITGTYKLWRYSTQYEGEYGPGKVEITDENGEHSSHSDQDLSPLRVRVRQTSKARDRMRGGDEIVEGYFFSCAGAHMMVVRNTLTFATRLTIFRSNRRDGVGSGIDTNSIYPDRYRSHRRSYRPRY